MNPINRTQAERFRTQDVTRTDSLQIMCCQCDHRSCVNDRGEKPKT